MQIKELLDLTLREILENYVVLANLECGGYYGVAPIPIVEKMYNEYNIEEEYPEAMSAMNLVDDEIIVSYDEEILTYDKLEKIMKNLGVNKK